MFCIFTAAAAHTFCFTPQYLIKCKTIVEFGQAIVSKIERINSLLQGALGWNAWIDSRAARLECLMFVVKKQFWQIKTIWFCLLAAISSLVGKRIKLIFSRSVLGFVQLYIFQCSATACEVESETFRASYLSVFTHVFATVHIQLITFRLTGSRWQEAWIFNLSNYRSKLNVERLRKVCF